MSVVDLQIRLHPIALLLLQKARLRPVIDHALHADRAFVIGIGVLLSRLRIKPHFFDVYLQLGANAVLLAGISGVLDSRAEWVYLLLLLILSAAAIYLGIRYRRFAFVAYGTLYGYAGLSIRVLDVVDGTTQGLAYLAITGSMVVGALVVLARRFGRDE